MIQPSKRILAPESPENQKTREIGALIRNALPTIKDLEIFVPATSYPESQQIEISYTDKTGEKIILNFPNETANENILRVVTRRTK